MNDGDVWELEASRQHNIELGARFTASPEQRLGADRVGVTVAHSYFAKPIRTVVPNNGDRSFANGAGIASVERS